MPPIWFSELGYLVLAICYLVLSNQFAPCFEIIHPDHGPRVRSQVQQVDIYHCISETTGQPPHLAWPVVDVDDQHLALFGDADVGSVECISCRRRVVNEQVDDSDALTGESADTPQIDTLLPSGSPSSASVPGRFSNSTMISQGIATSFRHQNYTSRSPGNGAAHLWMVKVSVLPPPTVVQVPVRVLSVAVTVK